jgi:hypothetical protein
MRQTTLRNTEQEKLRPTPAVVWRCRALDNTALAHRITAWQRRRVSVFRYGQEAVRKSW